MSEPGKVMRQTLDEADMLDLLGDLAEFLDNYADCEGNSAADWKPNKAMRLLQRVNEAGGF